jgi:hypothetical protein
MERTNTHDPNTISIRSNHRQNAHERLRLKGDDLDRGFARGSSVPNVFPKTGPPKPALRRKRPESGEGGGWQANLPRERPVPRMNVMKSLWASVQGDPVFMRRVNGWLAVFWIAMIPVSYELGWLSSVTFVAALSLWALVSGHWSAWQAARVEVEQERQVAEAQAEPLEEKVVDAIVEKTEIDEASA